MKMINYSLTLVIIGSKILYGVRSAIKHSIKCKFDCSDGILLDNLIHVTEL